jgi:Sporulation and spore germination.
MKKKMIFMLVLCMILTVAVAGLAGCGKNAGNSGKDEPQGSAEVKEQTYQVALFYANEDYIASGNESLEKFKVYEQEITSKPDDVYLKALDMLRTSPEKGYDTVLNDQIKFNSVHLDENTVTVDLSSSGLNGGSLDETFLIGQIVNTLTNSFEDVKQVQFLVDGKPAETLMGHVDTKAPFTRDLFAE